MKKLILIFIFVPSIVNAEYFEPFDTQDWILQIVFTGLVYIDYRQTMDFIDEKKVEETHETTCLPLPDSEINHIYIPLCVTTIEVTTTTYQESNPALGKKPSKQKVKNMILLGVASHAFVSWMLPKRYREAWQMVSLIVEMSAVDNNHKAGFKVQYYF